MVVSKEWLLSYEAVKDLLVSPVHFGDLFLQDEVKGKRLFVLDMGSLSFPTGEVIVADPLAFLDRNQVPYMEKVPVGVYPLDTLVAELGENNYRYVASRVSFSSERVVVYRNALKGDEDLTDVNKDTYFTFSVDAGLATVVDVKTRDVYCDFVEQWATDNPDKNIYDEYFAAEFKKSYEAKPQFQREAGDWINYKLGVDDLSVPMIQSGFGDGVYPVYFGYDKDGNVAELIIEYIFVGET